VLQNDVAKGIHRIEDAYTNWYLIEDGGKLTVVDCGTRHSWHSFLHAVEATGHQVRDVEAVVLTHGHFDHLGFAEQARRELDVPVFIHEFDKPLTKRPMSYAHERSRLPYLLIPKAAPIVGALLLQRAFWPSPIEKVETFTNGTLPVPGSPEVVFSPGHTDGHCALFLPDRDVLIAGDAFVTLNPYTGKKGPQLVAGAATADSTTAFASLDALAATKAATVLTGHGEAWTKGVKEAVRLAKLAGPS
jgi:glyoxylase-like metal-dependent hydrolase (beta-lactamase superfamily II)